MSVTQSLKKFPSSDYPMWYCPVFACSFRTEYVRNIKKHLTAVHRWDFDRVGKVIDRFFEFKETDKKIVCDKDLDDPTYPRTYFFEGDRV